MFKKFNRICLAIGLLALAPYSDLHAQGRPRGSRPSFSRMLAAFDANKDGMIGRNETPSSVWERIKIADKNGDSLVTKSEFIAAGGQA